MDSLQVTDAASAAVQKTPHRVTLDSIKDKIAERVFMRPTIEPTMTVCFLKMSNGFVVIGKAAPADPANFDRELGEKFAFEDAVRQIWPLEGYALRERLAEPRHENGKAYILGDEIRVAVRISDLPNIITGNPNWPDGFVINAVGEAARSIVHRLNDEEEDGTTLLHRAIDQAAENALEQGDEGFDEEANSDFTD